MQKKLTKLPYEQINLFLSGLSIQPVSNATWQQWKLRQVCIASNLLTYFNARNGFSRAELLVASILTKCIHLLFRSTNAKRSCDCWADTKTIEPLCKVCKYSIILDLYLLNSIQKSEFIKISWQG